MKVVVFLSLLVSAILFITTPKLKDFELIRSSHRGSEIFFLDREGAPLSQWRKDSQARSFEWVPLSEVSPAFVSALLKSEDRRFREHQGVDYAALGASLYQRLTKNSPRGGSTISMQTVKLISNDSQAWRGWVGKFRQIFAAHWLETKWSKEQILEAYINLLPFHGENRGLSSAVWNLFQKSPSGLTEVESTLLAVLVRAPNASHDLWVHRACQQEPGLCPDFQRALQPSDKKSSSLPKVQMAFHLAQRLSKDYPAGKVVTTVQREIQSYAEEIVREHILKLQDQNVHDAAVLVLENETGEVWAYVGGSGIYKENSYVDGVRALRQAGSTLKPFLYATAFEKNILKPDSWIEDSAVDIVFDRGTYKPQNHDRQFYGWVQVKSALGSSLNVPAVKVFKLLNDESFWTKLKEMNFRLLLEPDHYGPALALGVADVTLEDLTQAYRALARHGVYSPLKFVPGPSGGEEKVVYSPSSVDEVTQILAESQNRTLGFGLDSVLSVPGTAVKTGTSKDMRDNWCIGFNTRFTVGVWVGNFSGEPMWNVMGVSGAAPIWKKVMERLKEKYPEEKTLLAQGNERDAEVGQEPSRYPQVKILYPQDGMILALDPAIPSHHQKMPLLVQKGFAGNLKWLIDKKKFVSAQEPFLWTPAEGRHTFDLYQSGSLKESVQILVK